MAAPLLIQSGEVDRATTIAETRALFDVAPFPKQLRIVAGAGHVDLERHDPDGYRAVVLPFLGRHLPAGSGHRPV